MSRYVAFDLETAALYKEGERLDPLTGLGISCAVTLTDDEDLRLWYGWDGSNYRPRMTPYEVRMLIDYLERMQQDGAPAVTWNGLKFDWQVLGVESGEMERCAALALGHIDLMYAFFLIKGHYLGLKKAAAACGSHKGGEAVETGKDAPQAWMDGEYVGTLEYVRQDGVATRAVMEHLCQHWGFHWTTNRGKRAEFHIPEVLRPEGLHDLLVHQVMEWPVVNTWWMEKFPERRKEYAERRAGFLAWTGLTDPVVGQIT